MKKGQIGQIFIYLISTLIIILVLYYGYGAIKDIGSKQKEISYVKFQNALSEMIAHTSSDYGTVRIEDFMVPAGYTQVCLIDPSLIVTGDVSSIPANQYPIIVDSVKDNVQANIFVLPGGSPFYAPKMFIDTPAKFFCINATQGRIKLRIEGLGDKAKVESVS